MLSTDAIRDIPYAIDLITYALYPADKIVALCPPLDRFNDAMLLWLGDRIIPSPPPAD